MKTWLSILLALAIAHLSQAANGSPLDRTRDYMLTHTNWKYGSLCVDVSAIAKAGTPDDREAIRKYLVEVLNTTTNRDLKIPILDLVTDIPTFGYPVLGPQYLRSTVFRHYIDDPDDVDTTTIIPGNNPGGDAPI